MDDANALERLRKDLAAMGPDLLATLLQASAMLPEAWSGWTSHRGFEYLRCRLDFTQSELARKSGVTQARISLLEGGGDALVSTWRALYETMGFELLLVPVSRRSVAELEAAARAGRPGNAAFRQRARPRRRWLEYWRRRREEKAARLARRPAEG